MIRIYYWHRGERYCWPEVCGPRYIVGRTAAMVDYLIRYTDMNTEPCFSLLPPHPEAR